MEKHQYTPQTIYKDNLVPQCSIFYG